MKFPPKQSLKGQRFTRWEVIGDPFRLKNETQYAYKCQCDCGVIRIVRSYQLKKGLSQSCGCLATENAIKANTSHGMTNSPEFSTWDSMKDRCFHAGRKDSATYYDRKIGICKRWLGKKGFINFYNDMGKRPSPKHTIDRINNNKGYSPSNCKWSTPMEQANNKRNNRVVFFKGEKMTVSQAARKHGLRVDTLLWRLNHWGDINKALLSPKRLTRLVQR